MKRSANTVDTEEIVCSLALEDALQAGWEIVAFVKTGMLNNHRNSRASLRNCKNSNARKFFENVGRLLTFSKSFGVVMVATNLLKENNKNRKSTTEESNNRMGFVPQLNI